MTKIEKLEFSVPTYNCLRRAEIEYVEDILKWGNIENLQQEVKRLGKKSVKEILDKLMEVYGIDFVKMGYADIHGNPYKIKIDENVPVWLPNSITIIVDNKPYEIRNNQIEDTTAFTLEECFLQLPFNPVGKHTYILFEEGLRGVIYRIDWEEDTAYLYGITRGYL